MQIFFDVVYEGFYTTYGEYVKKPDGSWYMDFRRKYPCTIAVVAFDETGRMLGVLRGSYNPFEHYFYSYGTWVPPNARQKGIALNLWDVLIKAERIKCIGITALTDKGKTLVESLKRNFPKKQFHIQEHGQRELRVLNG